MQIIIVIFLFVPENEWIFLPMKLSESSVNCVAVALDWRWGKLATERFAVQIIAQFGETGFWVQLHR
jgi:hypothetical protein